jgi:hypothetical protein
MAESDGLRQAHGIPAVTAVRAGYVFAKNRRNQQGKKKHEPPEESGAGSGEEEKKGVDIKV